MEVSVKSSGLVSAMLWTLCSHIPACLQVATEFALGLSGALAAAVLLPAGGHQVWALQGAAAAHGPGRGAAGPSGAAQDDPAPQDQLCQGGAAVCRCCCVLQFWAPDGVYKFLADRQRQVCRTLEVVMLPNV